MSELPHVLYINLKHRKDRNDNILKQFAIWPKHKIHRIEAILNKDGALGCAYSHLKALEHAKKMNKDHVMIVEDDFNWTIPNKDILYKFHHKTLSNTGLNWNIILLSATFEKSIPCPNNNYNKLVVELTKRCNQTTTGYLINKSYIDTLYSFWKSTIPLRIWAMSDRAKKPYLHKIKYTHPFTNRTIYIPKYITYSQFHIQRDTCIDQTWKKLQHNNWYIMSPQVACQIESYSDIMNSRVNYTGL